MRGMVWGRRGGGGGPQVDEVDVLDTQGRYSKKTGSAFCIVFLFTNNVL